jgi:hypothetical protein
MAWHNKSNIMRNHIIPKELSRVGNEISDIFFASPRDFRQWADDNFTNVNEGDYFPTPNWRPNTLYLTLKQQKFGWPLVMDLPVNGWLPNELIYIKYNPVYGKFDELEEYSQYHVDVLVFRAKFSQRDEAFYPVRSDAISVHVEKRGSRNTDMSWESPSPYHYWTDMRAKGSLGDVFANAPIYEIPFDLGTNCLNFPKGFK